jgi:hypothetical protein
MLTLDEVRAIAAESQEVRGDVATSRTAGSRR